MSDEDVREIQLGGKELVFLFIAATVVSVVIFLCGVLVGRGALAAGRLTGTAGVAPDPGPAAASELTAFPDIGTTAAPYQLSYPDRLGRDEPPVENLKVLAAVPDEVVVPPPAVTEPAGPSPAVQAPWDPAAAPPARTGFVVQVAALRERYAADAIANRLIDKGYPAYVLAPAQGAPAAVYRVRVGTYENRREAEEVAARLESEEQFKPWIVR